LQGNRLGTIYDAHYGSKGEIVPVKGEKVMIVGDDEMIVESMEELLLMLKK
jgi:hypothetical protein